MWFLLIFISATFSALSMVAMKLGVQGVNPVLASAMSTIIVFLISWFVVVASGLSAQLAEIDARTFGFLVLAGLATGGVGLANYGALKLGEVDTYVAVVRCSMVLSVVLSFLLLGDPFTMASGFGTAFILIGTVLMIDRRSRSSRSRLSAKWAILMAVAIALSSAATLLGKIGINEVNPLVGTAMFSVPIVLLSNGLALATGEWKGAQAMTRRELAFVLLAGAASAGTEITFYAGLKLQLTSIVMPVDKLLSGLITVVLAYFVFGEKITKRSAIALTLIGAGSVAIIL